MTSYIVTFDVDVPEATSFEDAAIQADSLIREPDGPPTYVTVKRYNHRGSVDTQEIDLDVLFGDRH